MKGPSSNQTDPALGANALPPSHTYLPGPDLSMFPPQAKGDCSAGPPLYDRVRRQPVLLLARGPMLRWPSYVTVERESGGALL